jgi:arylsulfatase A
MFNMKYKINRLLSTLALIVLAGNTIAADSTPAERPNIVVILADDLGYGDVHCYNPERGKIPTPHIDQLASQGIRFTDAHSSSAVCTPSRYTILTGRYHWRSRLQKEIVWYWEKPLITSDRMTIGTLAKQKGFRTACIGKWHLGWDWQIPSDQSKLFKEKAKRTAVATDAHRAVWKEVFSKPIGGGPIELGFDIYFGVDVPNWPPFCFIEQNRTVGIPSEFLPVNFLKTNIDMTLGPAVKGWALEPILPELAMRASDFITTSASKAEPYLLYLSLTSPHSPLAVNKEWQGKSGLGRYADFVMETDAVVGQVLEAVKKSGEEKNTVVIFTSDNGCAPYIGVPGLEKKGHYPSGPLRGYKGDAYDGGHRVPFIVRWPMVVETGVVSDHLVHQADLMATFADILGAKLPDNAGEDSFSILPLLKGRNSPVRTHAVSASWHGLPAVRLGQWKYIPAPGSGGWKWKRDNSSQPVQLYNLASDIGEKRNVASEYPERVKQMQELLESLVVKGRSTPGTDQPNDVEVLRFVP